MSDSNPAGVTRVVRLFTDIALFRRGPEDLPASAALLVLTVAAYLVFTLVLDTALGLGLGLVVGSVLTDCAFAILWYWVVLRLAGRPERFLQTTTAVFGFQVVAAPLYGVLHWFMLTRPEKTELSLPELFLIALLSVWMLAVNVRILRAALEWRLGYCVALVLLQGFLGLILALSIFPEGITAAKAG